MIQGFTAQIALGVFYSSPFPVFLSKAASPAGLALHPTTSLSLLYLVAPNYLPSIHFVPSLSTFMFLLLSLAPSPVWPESPDCLLHSAVLGSFSSPCWWNQEMQNIQCDVDTEWLKLGKVIEN